MVRERKEAPELEENLDVFNDDRKAQLERLDAKDPEMVHSYQSGRVTESELMNKGQEVVRTEDGKPLMHGEDIVVRQARKLFQKRRVIEEARSLKTAEAMRKGKEETLKRVASPVTPKKKDD